jgi:glycosyltransferase involved in cell wall biosynthesis
MSLRVLLVHSHGTDLTFGGAERHVAQLADGLAARGMETRVLSAFPGASTLPPERTRVLYGSDWRADRARRLQNHVGDLLSRPTRELEEAVVWSQADVVHTNNLPGITTGIWEVCRRAGIAVVHTLHDYHLLCPRVTLLRPNGEACEPHPLLCGFRTRRMARWAPAVSHLIGVSRFVLQSHAQLFPGAKLELVHLPIDVTDAHLAPPGERLETLGFIGALEPIKGVAELLRAVPALADLGCRVRIAGNGRLRGEVEAAAKRYSSLDYVGVVTGTEKNAFLESCDAGILPSIWNEPGGPPYAVLELLAVGRPVLISPRGGLGEALGEGHPGLFRVEPTAEGIVEAIRTLAEDEELWREAVALVRPPAEVVDGVEGWLDEHERIYRSAAGARAA